ncbi:MAG: hypothetical protein LKJ25_02745 [Clostridia bacterium]|jgi:flagellar biosynthesis chaperone FliJ|nr:hypothetical protein [Clostridia bacterium]
MSISTNYANSLPLSWQNSSVASTGISASDDVEKIEKQIQAIENEILEIESSSDTDGSTGSPSSINGDSSGDDSILKSLEKQLETLNDELKVAKTKASSSSKASPVSGSQQNFDQYIKGTDEEESAGIYSVKSNDKDGYNISFKPYSDNTKEDTSADSVKENASDNEEINTVKYKTDTDDSEIKTLKNEKKELEQQISQASSSGKSEDEIEQLQKQLSTIESELNTKESD